MGSKYDEYWVSQLPQIQAQLQLVADGAPTAVSLPGLTRLGHRNSWYGVADVQAEEIT
jgi:hypothetical protein